MSAAKRVDGNHAEIVRALRQVGCSILDLSPIGHGCPDLLAGRAGRLYLLEVKNPQGRNRVNEQQQAWHAGWPGLVAVVRSVDEALRAVGVEVSA